MSDAELVVGMDVSDSGDFSAVSIGRETDKGWEIVASVTWNEGCIEGAFLSIYKQGVANGKREVSNGL